MKYYNLEEIVISKLGFHTNYIRKHKMFFVKFNRITKDFYVFRSNFNEINVIHLIFRIIYAGYF